VGENIFGRPVPRADGAALTSNRDGWPLPSRAGSVWSFTVCGRQNLIVDLLY
jgi:hypothetical protein